MKFSLPTIFAATVCVTSTSAFAPQRPLTNNNKYKAASTYTMSRQNNNNNNNHMLRTMAPDVATNTNTRLAASNSTEQGLS